MKSNQSGAALLVSLVILLILTIAALAAARHSTVEQNMSGSNHQYYMSFNAAESALANFFEQANTGDDLQPGHVLFETRINTNTSQCYDSSGNIVADCAEGAFDADHAGAITISTNAEFLGCNKPCPNFSLGMGRLSASCAWYQIDGEGDVGGLETSVTQWAYQVGACPN